MNGLGVDGIFGIDCWGVKEAYRITLTLLRLHLHSQLVFEFISPELHLHLHFFLGFELHM